MSPASDRLRGLVTGVRRHLRNRSVLAALCWTGVGVMVLWLVAWALVGPQGWRQGSDVPVLIVTLMTLWALAVLLAVRVGIVRWFGEVRVSGAIERAARLRAGEVRGSLELARAMPHGVSASLAGHAAERAARDLGGYSAAALSGDLGDAVTRWTRRGLAFLTGAVLMVVSLGVLAPSRTAQAWAGLASPLAIMADPEFQPLVVSPGTTEVVRGADVEVRIEAVGRASIELSWQETGDVQRVERLEVVDGRASHVIRDVSAETEYRIRGDVGPASELFRLTPVDPLFVGDLLIGVEYPPHTGMPDEEHRMSAPTLRLPVGSVLTFAGRANRTLATADLVRDSGDVELPLDVTGAEFGARWTPGRDGTYTWRFLDAQGDEAELLPDPLRIELVADQAPAVRIPVPGADTLLPLDLRQPLVIEAQDDYGLGSLELVAYRVTALGQRQEPVIQRLDLEGTRGAMIRPLLDVSGWELMPGDTVRYFARVTDNAPRGQVAVSPEYVLRMPSAGDMRREVERSIEAVADRVEALSGEAGRQAEENRARAREGETRRDPQEGRSGSREESARDFEEQEAMRQALEEQAGLSEEVEAMLSELGEMERAMENAGQADPALREQLEELQQLLREAAGEDLGERMRQLAESLERQDPRAATRSLEEMAREQELLRERLEESLDRFRRAAVEQDFRATTTEAEELARQEQALADALREEADPAERAQQQEELAGRTEELQTSLERLQERLREMDEQAAAEGVAEAGNRAEQAESEMREAGRESDRGGQEQAAERAEQAAQQMSEAARELQQAQQEMAEQKTQAAQRALQQTADDALALARRQAELRAQMRGAGRERISGMRGEEASLLQGLENMAENLRVSTEGQVPDGRGISEQMGRAMESLQRTIDAMERPRSLSGSPLAEAERVVAELNELALMTLSSADQMGQDGQGQQQGAEQDMQEALENLAQEQGSLANDAGQIVPMQLGQQATAEQAQQLAQGQQSVSDRLGELSDMPSSEGALGDLEQFAAEAAELAAELAAGRLTPETAQRQERLFHRLLDAGRSLEQEEFSEERESESAGAFERTEVGPLDPSQLGVMPYRLPDSEQLRALSPGVRQLILDYFERLNRERPGQGGSRR